MSLFGLYSRQRSSCCAEMETSVSPWFLAITALSEVVEPAINNEYAFLTISATVYYPVADPFNFDQEDEVGPARYADRFSPSPYQATYASSFRHHIACHIMNHILDPHVLCHPRLGDQYLLPGPRLTIYRHRSRTRVSRVTWHPTTTQFSPRTKWSHLLPVPFP